MVEITLKKYEGLSDGSYTGTIVEIKFRGPDYGNPDAQYNYVDVWVEETESKTRLKYGCPFPAPGNPVTDKSMFGRLLVAFGVNQDSPIDPGKALVGQEVQFMVMKKGDFSEIVQDSIKPKS